MVELKPCFRPIPNRGSQAGGLQAHYQGSQLRLVTGDYVRVLEDYEVAHDRLWPQEERLGPNAARPSGDVPHSLPIPQGSISGLAQALTEEGSPPPSGTPEPKKATPKKAAPKGTDPHPTTLKDGKTVEELAAEAKSEEKDED